MTSLILVGIHMDDKEKLIYDLQQKVCSLESRVQYLQEILAEAKIPYEVNKSVKIKMNISPAKEDQGARIKICESKEFQIL